VASVLILVLALVVLTGTIIDQAPASVLADHAAYDRWLVTARGKYGSWTDLLDQLQLFGVFHSLLFRGLLALLALSIVVCTMSRWRSVWTTAFHTRTRVNESFLLHARFHARLDVAAEAEESAERIRLALSHAGYRVRIEDGAESVAVFADKNRLSRFGTFFTHLGLVLILGGAIAGGVWGFKDPQFVVAEGSTRELGLGTGIAVRLDRSVDEYYADGRPRTLRSDITLIDGGSVVKQGAVEVNAPLRYKGVAFHESFYGQAAVLKVQDASGQVLFNEGVPLALRTSDGQRPTGSFELPGRGLIVYVVGPIMGAPDSLIRAGEVRLDIYQDYVRVARPRNLAQGVPAQVQGLTFTFEREGRFAGLNVVKDPGTNIIWAAGALMVVGMVMLFYFPPRRLWALCTRRPDGGTGIVLGMPAQRDVSLAGEFEKLHAKVSRAVGAESHDAREDGGDDV
jgi:cytochrome c biogenesis protein